MSYISPLSQWLIGHIWHLPLGQWPLCLLANSVQLQLSFAQSFFSPATFFGKWKKTELSVVYLMILAWKVVNNTITTIPVLRYLNNAGGKKCLHAYDLTRGIWHISSPRRWLPSAQPPIFCWPENKWKDNSSWQQLFLAWPSGGQNTGAGVYGGCYCEEQCLEAEPRLVLRG